MGHLCWTVARALTLPRSITTRPTFDFPLVDQVKFDMEAQKRAERRQRALQVRADLMRLEIEESLRRRVGQMERVKNA